MKDFPWGNKRRFNSYSEYFRKESGGRVQKLAIDAGFTCPNRDGSKGAGGCTYCDNGAFNPSYCHPGKSVRQQIEEGIGFHEKRYRRAKQYLAYFQPYSNTYAPLERLQQLYSEALSVPGIAGLVIGTRPDCIDEEILGYLRELSSRYYIMVELGLESCYDRTLLRINRGHTFGDSVRALEMASQFQLKTGIHLIFGLPGESRRDMLKEAEIISSLPVNNVKFHQLQLIKGTPMASEYEKDPEDFVLFTMDDYIEFIIDFTERLNPSFVIERFAGEVPPRFLEGPGWGLIRNDQLLQKIEKRMEERGTWQGRLFSSEF